MQTLTIPIPVPDGYEISDFDKSSKQMTVKPCVKRKDPKGRPGTFAEVLEDVGMTLEEFEQKTVGDDDDDIAYKQAKLIRKALNKDKKPDWDSSAPKYFPWFYMGSSGFRFDDVDGWRSRSAVGSRLSYHDDDDAKYAALQFTDIFKRLMVWE